MKSELHLDRESVWKWLVVFVGFSLLVPAAALADSNLCGTGFLCAIDNKGGTLTDTAAHGLTLTGSHVTVIGDQTDFTSPYLGTISLVTGALSGGTLGGGGTFAGGAGSSFVIHETSGSFIGLLFSGSFSGPVNWALTSQLVGGHCPLGGCTYILSGPVSGTWEGTTPETGATIQFTVTTNTPFKPGGSIALTGGISNFGTVPEPGSLGLMGTGLLGLGFVVRAKFKGRV